MSSHEVFANLCWKLLEVCGNDLYPKRKDKTARLATVVTLAGTVYVKETNSGLHVSSPCYSSTCRIYHWIRDSDLVVCWDSAEADKVTPFLEKKLALDLMSDV